MNSEIDTDWGMFTLKAAIISVVVVGLVVGFDVLRKRLRGPIRRALRWDYDPYGRNSTGEIVPAARFARDAEAVRRVDKAASLATNRIVLNVGNGRITLGERGTTLMRSVVFSSDIAISKIEGLLGPDLDRLLNRYRFSSITNDDDKVLDFVERARRSPARVRIGCGGENTVLTEQGTQILCGLLLAPHKSIDAIEKVFRLRAKRQIRRSIESFEGVEVGEERYYGGRQHPGQHQRFIHGSGRRRFGIFRR